MGKIKNIGFHDISRYIFKICKMKASHQDSQKWQLFCILNISDQVIQFSRKYLNVVFRCVYYWAKTMQTQKSPVSEPPPLSAQSKFSPSFTVDTQPSIYTERTPILG